MWKSSGKFGILYGMDHLARYRELAPNAKTRPAAIQFRLGVLERHYNEAGRYYHTLGHIEHGFQQHAKFFGDMPLLLFFAWVYHDAIYDPTGHNNEGLSAELFKADNYELGFSASEEDQIVELIISTTHTGEKNLITDIDLSGLGLPAPEYDVNTARIRHEYEFAEDAAWVVGRSEFLTKFLATPAIFFTPQFKDAYETQARENMRRELSSLTRKRSA